MFPTIMCLLRLLRSKEIILRVVERKAEGWNLLILEMRSNQTLLRSQVYFREINRIDDPIDDLGASDIALRRDGLHAHQPPRGQIRDHPQVRLPFP